MNYITSRIAVVLSTYNGENYLQDFLRSLGQQDCRNMSLFVRDDGSIDNTCQILKRQQGLKEYPIQIIDSDIHIGAAQSFLHLLADAGDGFDYYAFSDQDDVWLPDKMTRAVKKLGPISEDIPALYCSRLEYVDEELHFLKWSSMPRRVGFGNALVENIASGCSIVMNQSARTLILNYLPDFCLMHDWWCYLTVSCFGKIVFDEQSAVLYRQHRRNAVGVATSLTDYHGRRVRRFFRSDGGIFQLSDQAKAFINAFGDKIPEEIRAILNLVIAGKSNLKDRSWLAKSRKIWRQNKMDDVLMRILILLNHY